MPPLRRPTTCPALSLFGPDGPDSLSDSEGVGRSCVRCVKRVPKLGAHRRIQNHVGRRIVACHLQSASEGRGLGRTAVGRPVQRFTTRPPQRRSPGPQQPAGRCGPSRCPRGPASGTETQAGEAACRPAQAGQYRGRPARTAGGQAAESARGPGPCDPPGGGALGPSRPDPPRACRHRRPRATRHKARARGRESRWNEPVRYRWAVLQAQDQAGAPSEAMRIVERA